MLSITLVERDVRSDDKISHGLRALDEADAAPGVPGCVASGHQETMIAAANSKRLPSVLYTRTRTTRNASLTYGASDVDVARDAARLADKILKGAKAGDLPGRPKVTEESRPDSGCRSGFNLGLIALVRPIETDPLALRLHAPYLIGCTILVASAPLWARARTGSGRVPGAAVSIVSRAQRLDDVE
jgi:hypothetical protein